MTRAVCFTVVRTFVYLLSFVILAYGWNEFVFLFQRRLSLSTYVLFVRAKPNKTLWKRNSHEQRNGVLPLSEELGQNEKKKKINNNNIKV